MWTVALIINWTAKQFITKQNHLTGNHSDSKQMLWKYQDRCVCKEWCFTKHGILTKSSKYRMCYVSTAIEITIYDIILFQVWQMYD